MIWRIIPCISTPELSGGYDSASGFPCAMGLTFLRALRGASSWLCAYGVAPTAPSKAFHGAVSALQAHLRIRRPTRLPGTCMRGWEHRTPQNDRWADPGVFARGRGDARRQHLWGLTATAGCEKTLPPQIRFETQTMNPTREGLKRTSLPSRRVYLNLNLSVSATAVVGKIEIAGLRG